MSTALEADLRRAIEAHERSGVYRDPPSLAAFLCGYHAEERRRRRSDRCVRAIDLRTRAEAIEEGAGILERTGFGCLAIKHRERARALRDEAAGLES